ncbi:MAG: hypothetical protein GY937_25705 [bacterium]|nr:hypothetical protein [bacterium]
MHLRRALHGLLTFLLVFQPLLGPTAALATIDDSSQFSSRLGRPNPTNRGPASATSSLFTGDAVHEIPIDVPQDPGGMTPRLALRYNSGSRSDSWVGYGWSLGASSIRRSLRDGTPRYSDAGFCSANPTVSCDPTAPDPCPQDLVYYGSGSSAQTYKTYCEKRDQYELDGQLLVFEGTSGNIDTYRTRSESFAKIELDVANNYWRVTTKDGIERTYGWRDGQAVPTAHVEKSAGLTFEWLVAREEDPHGNQIDYVYQHDNGYAFLDEVTYGQLAGDGWRIDFVLEPGPDSRILGTARDSYRAGFLQRLAVQLKEVVVEGGNGERIRRYEPAYSKSAESGRLLLDSVVVHGTTDGSQGGTTPATETRFTYSTNTNSPVPRFVGDTSWVFYDAAGDPVQAPSITWNGYYTGTILADMNGDGLPDVYSSTTNGSVLYLNTGQSFTAQHSHPLPLAGSPAVPVVLAAKYDNKWHQTAWLASDLTRDGRPDFIASTHYFKSGGSGVVHLHGSEFIVSTPNGWQSQTWPGYSLLGTARLTVNRQQGLGPRTGTTEGNVVVADLNGDGLPELNLRGQARVDRKNAPGTYLTWTSDSYAANLGGGSFGNPPMASAGVSGSNGFFLYSDRYRVPCSHSQHQDRCVYGLNNAIGSALFNFWIMERRGLVFGDVNSDGLADYGYSRHYVSQPHNPVLPAENWFRLNHGDGTFSTSASTGWQLPEYMIGDGGASHHDKGIRLVDVNGDGQLDVLRGDANGSGNPIYRAWLNDGEVVQLPASAWVRNDDWAPANVFVHNNGSDSGVRLGDINGDGLVDSFVSNHNGSGVTINQGRVPDLLTDIEHPLGGTTYLDYSSSTDFIESGSQFPHTDGVGSVHGRLPFPKQVVSAIETDDGRGGAIGRTEYAYYEGAYDPVEGEFLGFGRVEVAEGEGPAASFQGVRERIHHFHQEVELLGVPKRTKISQISGASTTILEETSIKYRPDNLATKGFEALPECTTKTQYDPANSSVFRRTATHVENYDIDGNPLEIVALGLVSDEDCTDVVSDVPRRTSLQYASDPNGRIRDRVSRRERSEGSTVIRRTDFLYDGQVLGSLGTKGELTSQIEIEDISSGIAGPTTTFTYTAFGAPAITVNPRENAGELGTGEGRTITTYTPPAGQPAFGYPALSVNGLSHVTATAYQSDSICTAYPNAAGLPAVQADPNLVETVRCYDVLGRPTVEDVRQSGTVYAHKTWAYDDTPCDGSGCTASVTESVQVATGGSSRSTTTLLDGFGRPIETQTDGPMHGGSEATSIVKGTRYDGLGRVAAETIPKFGGLATEETLYEYDGLDRVTKVTRPGTGRIWNTTYGADSTLVADPIGIQRKTVQNGFGEASSVESPLDNATTFSYNGAGELEHVTPPTGANDVLTIAYDDLGRRTSVDDPDRGLIQFTAYDANGNLLVQDGPESGTVDAVTWTYDPLDRPKTRLGSGISDSWFYDDPAVSNSIGRATFISASGVYDTHVGSYHPLGMVATRQQGALGFSFTYNMLGDLIGEQVPTGTQLTWTRDALGYVTGVSDPDGDYATGVEWDALLRIAKWTAGNGVPTEIELEGTSSGSYTGRASKIDIGATGSLASRDYTYWANDFVLMINDSAQTKNWAFAYDNVGRLKSAFGPYGPTLGSQTLHYGYDTLGNLTCQDATAPTSGGSCTGGVASVYAGTRPHAPSQIGADAVTYDADGNLEALGSRGYDYDPLGRLGTVQDSSVNTALYNYHADGDLGHLRYYTGGTLTTNLHRVAPEFEYNITDQEGIIHVQLGDQTIATRTIPNFNPGTPPCAGVLPAIYGDYAPWYHFLPCLLLGLLALAIRAGRRAAPYATRRRLAAAAMVLLHLIAYGIPTGVLLAPEPAHATVPSNTRFYHTDHLGSTVVMTFWDGATPQTSYYRPFGQAATGGGATLPEDFGFTGQRFEDEVGLYDYGARWYDPALGRFLQPDSIVPDPADPMSWNPYSYVRNNPVNRIDPTGNEDRGSYLSVGQPSFFGSLIGGFREAGIRGVSWGLSRFLDQQAASNLDASENIWRNFYQSSYSSPDDFQSAFQRTSLRSGGLRVGSAFASLGAGFTEPPNIGEAVFYLATGGAGAIEQRFLRGASKAGKRLLPFRDSDRLQEVNRTLDRIESSGPFPYRRDGIVFRNDQGRLPEGNYREYTVETPGAPNRGARRVVVDQDSARSFYTDDHYGSFTEIDPRRR